MKELPDLLIRIGICIILCAVALKAILLLIMWMMGV